MEEENLVKKTCKELGITQKELAEKIGVHDVTVRSWTSKGKIPKIARNFMNLLLEKKRVFKLCFSNTKIFRNIRTNQGCQNS